MGITCPSDIRQPWRGNGRSVAAGGLQHHTKQLCGKYVGAMSDRARQDEGAVEEATYLATEGERAQRAGVPSLP
jgi:hypothetical protein